MARKKPARTITSQAGSSVFIDRTADIISYDEASSSGASDSEEVERHPEFFFDNTLIAIRVGKTMFNVHKYQLSKSEVFSDRFKKPKPEDDKPEEGSSPEHPIKLRGISVDDFAALLRVLYASHFSSHQPAPKASLIVPAFRLANVFKFGELCTFLLPLAEKNLNDVDKIVFAREYDIKEWLAPAHVRLCKREEHLSGEEARKLGVESVLIISRMREQHRNRPPAPASPLTISQTYCYGCAGMSSTSNSVTSKCGGCGKSYGGCLRYVGITWKPADAPATINDHGIEIGVKKWVENGCVINN